ncbi:MAG: hypothetical protein D6679_09110 [Candidatus Hydrogenedentota bacterium]|nr:MAG: hypothetical protein D6679_09110 [Candidatus Hydrogenedentota bacterium]
MKPKNDLPPLQTAVACLAVFLFTVGVMWVMSRAARPNATAVETKFHQRFARIKGSAAGNIRRPSRASAAKTRPKGTSGRRWEKARKSSEKTPASAAAAAAATVPRTTICSHRITEVEFTRGGSGSAQYISARYEGTGGEHWTIFWSGAASGRVSGNGSWGRATTQRTLGTNSRVTFEVMTSGCNDTRKDFLSATLTPADCPKTIRH